MGKDDMCVLAHTLRFLPPGSAKVREAKCDNPDENFGFLSDERHKCAALLCMRRANCPGNDRIYWFFIRSMHRSACEYVMMSRL